MDKDKILGSSGNVKKGETDG